MLFIAFRQLLMPLMFTNKELNALDGEDEQDLDWTKEDFFHVPLPV
jgi:hypothetical protein